MSEETRRIPKRRIALVISVVIAVLGGAGLAGWYFADGQPFWGAFWAVFSASYVFMALRNPALMRREG
jgi:hypothetical protein